MVGRRVYPKGDEIPCQEPGDYGKDGKHGRWFIIPPAIGFSVGGIPKHTVVEHEDGTITVSPSILVYGANDKSWHGYLERGVWREC